MEQTLAPWVRGLGIAAGSCALGAFVVPAAGAPALLSAGLAAAMLLLAAGWLALSGLSRRNGRAIFLPLAVLALLLGLWEAGRVGADLVQGPQTVTLSRCQVSSTTGRHGIFSLHYNISGIGPDGQEHSYRITGSMYDALEDRDTVTIECYEHTGRVYSY